MFKIGKSNKQRPTIDPELHDIVKAPYVVTKKGKPQAVVKVDEISLEQDILRVEGWLAAVNAPLTVDIWQDGKPMAMEYKQVDRLDVSSSMKRANPALQSQGFILQGEFVADTDDGLNLVCQLQADTAPLRFSLPPSNKSEDDSSSTQLTLSERKIDINKEYIPPSFRKAQWQQPDPRKVNAHLDRFGIIPQRGGLLAGWVVAQPGWKIWLIDSQGHSENLDNAIRYQRQDIVELFRNQFGQHTVDAGFVMQWPYSLEIEDTIKLIAIHPEKNEAFEILQLGPEEVPNDPEGYARWAFTVPTPAEKFNERLNQWEGALIECLLAERKAWFDAHQRAPNIQTLGAPPADPTLSLIIPLYSRWDFMEHQLLAFSQDSDLLETTEVIYVVDDPRILTAISNEVENLHRLYNVPFKVVWGHRNRGFSGANNLGVSVSRGCQVLLLNSDAFPTSPGWTNQLSSLLDDNPQYGLLGARLLNPEGGLQHAGMAFFYSESWKVWLNKHPLAGLAPELDDVPEGAEIVDKPAVTGACVIMQRSLYDQLGGLDEGYLIGDFEDSDLCLKVLSEGYQLGYVPGVSLVHLERQSFSSLGDTSFRTLVVRFNAWRHTKRWGEQIQSVMQSFS